MSGPCLPGDGPCQRLYDKTYTALLQRRPAQEPRGRWLKGELSLEQQPHNGLHHLGLVICGEPFEYTASSQPSKRLGHGWKDAPGSPFWKRMSHPQQPPGVRLPGCRLGLAAIICTQSFPAEKEFISIWFADLRSQDMGWSPCSATHQPYD